MPRLREAASRLLGKTARAARFALRTWQAAKGIVVVLVFDIVIVFLFLLLLLLLFLILLLLLLRIHSLGVVREGR